jgi:hypothetical protein
VRARRERSDRALSGRPTLNAWATRERHYITPARARSLAQHDIDFQIVEQLAGQGGFGFQMFEDA